MSNLTSTLTLQLKDEGLAAKAKADAEALKKLGASSADLKKLAAANPHVAKTVAHLDELAARGAKLDAFRAGARNLAQLGTQMRAARAEVGATAAALAMRAAVHPVIGSSTEDAQARAMVEALLLDPTPAIEGIAPPADRERLQ